MISDRFLGKLLGLGAWLCLIVGWLHMAVAALGVPLGYRFSEQLIHTIIGLGAASCFIVLAECMKVLAARYAKKEAAE